MSKSRRLSVDFQELRFIIITSWAHTHIYIYTNFPVLQQFRNLEQPNHMLTAA